MALVCITVDCLLDTLWIFRAPVWALALTFFQFIRFSYPTIESLSCSLRWTNERRATGTAAGDSICHRPGWSTNNCRHMGFWQPVIRALTIVVLRIEGFVAKTTLDSGQVGGETTLLSGLAPSPFLVIWQLQVFLRNLTGVMTHSPAATSIHLCWGGIFSFRLDLSHLCWYVKIRKETWWVWLPKSTRTVGP